MLKKLALSIDDAKKMAATCRAEAEKNKWNVVIAILDDGGHLMYLERMDGTQKASSRIAFQKGKTAIMFKRPSGALEKVVAGGRVAVMSLGATTVEGGLPVVVDGEYVGAIGVSGVQSHEDARVAQAGIDALLKG
ncbi:MAG: heme-binding protein [Alphaproteobacteria bacterium]|nr:heme-binding protein [Alphaproteobacteria bacterium]